MANGSGRSRRWSARSHALEPDEPAMDSHRHLEIPRPQHDPEQSMSKTISSWTRRLEPLGPEPKRARRTYGVALLDPPRLENVCDPRDLPQQLDVRNLLVLPRLIGLVQDRNLQHRESMPRASETESEGRRRGGQLMSSSGCGSACGRKGGKTDLVGLGEGPSERGDAKQRWDRRRSAYV